MSTQMLSHWMRSQKLQGPSTKSLPVFYRNLEDALDIRRREHGLYTIKTNLWREDVHAVDFSSNDTLALGASGALRAAFMDELALHPLIPPGAGSSRVMDGNYAYLERAEEEIAAFHGGEAGLIVGSGFDANLAIFAAIPRPGDAIVYDELVHASTHDGMQLSQALIRVAFRHNDVDSFREALMDVAEQQVLFRQGKRCVIVAVESFYSMDGDVCPLKELVEIAKEVFPAGNVAFLVDEAHSTGAIGPNGAGLVCQLGLEREVAIRLHTFGKALSASGGISHITMSFAFMLIFAIAIILGNKTLKSALMNLARPVIYTTAPAFSIVAAARAGYKLLQSGQTKLVIKPRSIRLNSLMILHSLYSSLPYPSKDTIS
jgi:8-amino-7-oxononanoate synthase